MMTSTGWIGHFWVAFILYFKATPRTKPLIWKWFVILMQMKPFSQERFCISSHFESEFLELRSGLLGRLLSRHFLCWKICHLFRSDYSIAIGHAFGFFLQKIAVMEMIIRTVKQLFKVHMQSGEWHKAYFFGYLPTIWDKISWDTYFALKGLS